MNHPQAINTRAIARYQSEHAAALDYVEGFRHHQQAAETPVTALKDLSALRAAIAECEVSIVGYMRHEGASWREVGEALGITHQSARVRFSEYRGVR